MLEYCVCCQSYAPAWDEPDYADWQVALTPAGQLLGVVCAACFIDEDLAFLGLPPDGAERRDDLAGRRRAARRRAEARRASRRAA
jgi:hypothetical protein